MKQLILVIITLALIACQKENEPIYESSKLSNSSLNLEIRVAENLFLRSSSESLTDLEVRLFGSEIDALDLVNPLRVLKTDENGQVSFNFLEHQTLYIGFSFQDSIYTYAQNIGVSSSAHRTIQVYRDNTPISFLFREGEIQKFHFQMGAPNLDDLSQIECHSTTDTLQLEVIERLGLSSWVIKDYLISESEDSTGISPIGTLHENIWSLEDGALYIRPLQDQLGATSYFYFQNYVHHLRVDFGQAERQIDIEICSVSGYDFSKNSEQLNLAPIVIEEKTHSDLLLNKTFRGTFNKSYFLLNYIDEDLGFIRSESYSEHHNFNIDNHEKYIKAWNRIL